MELNTYDSDANSIDKASIEKFDRNLLNNVSKSPVLYRLKDEIEFGLVSSVQDINQFKTEFSIHNDEIEDFIYKLTEKKCITILDDVIYVNNKQWYDVLSDAKSLSQVASLVVKSAVENNSKGDSALNATSRFSIPDDPEAMAILRREVVRLHSKMLEIQEKFHSKKSKEKIISFVYGVASELNRKDFKL